MKIFIKFSNSHQHNYLKNKIFKNESLRLVVSRSKMLEKYQIRSFIKRALSAPGVGVSAKEMKKFDSLASYWWDESGFFKALHSFNRVRVPWIVDSLSQRASYSDPLKGFKLLEVGCGGGILTEPLGRLGASVTAIDISAQSLEVAEARLELPGNERLKENITYVLSSANEIAEAENGHHYDAIVLSEVIEHNDDQQGLINTCESLLKPEGMLFVTTLNKNPISYLLGIVAAEYILNIVPAGTHEYEKFIRPQTLASMMRTSGFDVLESKGLLYNPVCNSWIWCQLDIVNYASVAKKPSETEHLRPTVEDEKH